MADKVTKTGVDFIRALAVVASRTAVEKCWDRDYAQITDDDLRRCEFLQPAEAARRKRLIGGFWTAYLRQQIEGREHATLH